MYFDEGQLACNRQKTDAILQCVLKLRNKKAKCGNLLNKEI